MNSSSLPLRVWTVAGPVSAVSARGCTRRRMDRMVPPTPRVKMLRTRPVASAMLRDRRQRCRTMWRCRGKVMALSLMNARQQERACNG
ncbi:hypothetical protein D3C71_1909980 [compost metagenome]